MTDSAVLERSYRRVLACYPRSFRRHNEDEILARLEAAFSVAVHHGRQTRWIRSCQPRPRRSETCGAAWVRMADDR